MNELEQLKERISSLSAEELEQLKAYLATEEEEGDNAPTEPTEEQPTEELPSDEPTEEEPPIDKPTEQSPTEEELPTEEEPTEELPTEGVPMEKSEKQPIEDDISKMQKYSDISQEDTAPSVIDEQGEELPVDYQQIIDAQSAKIMALEAENTSLKSKVDGAFGYSAKPPTPAKVNRLYDDATDVHFHK